MIAVAGMACMDDGNTGAYLTERLRRVAPETYERELERRRKASRRQGFVIGALVASAVLVAAMIAIIVFSPDTAEDLIARFG